MILQRIRFDQQQALQVDKIYLGHQILLMQGQQNLFFSPNSQTTYKITSALDNNKAFTIQNQSNKLTIADYHGQTGQLFKVFQNNNKYAFVNDSTFQALHVEQENRNDGGVVKTDAGEFPSSFFEIVPVTTGQWAGKACCIKTFAEGKSLDIKGGKANQNTEICQWKFHGGVNQQWLIIPADNVQSNSPKKVEAHQEPVHPDVPAVFQPVPNTAYKILSFANNDKCLTVDKNNKLTINDFKKEASQKFHLPWENTKFGIVVSSNNSGLCIFQDNKANGVQIISDNDKHASSWFEIARSDKGPLAHKGYLIKTHAPNRVFDNAGDHILQYDAHQGQNQLWLIVPFAEEKPNKVNNKNEAEVADVDVHFKVNSKILYKISSILDKQMVLTVNNDMKLEVTKHHNNKNQHFHIYQEGNKFAIVDQKSEVGLCIFQDKKDNGVQVMADKDKHTSSWFEFVRADKGPFAHKGYLIKTHANRGFDMAGNKDHEVKTLLQYDIHEGGNQVWSIEPLRAGKVEGGKSNWGTQLLNVRHIFNPVHIGNNQGMGFAQNSQFKPNQNYIFYAVHGNGIKALDISQGQNDHNHLIMYSFHGAPNQRFVFEQEGNLYRIKSVKENKYIGVVNDSPNDGAAIKCEDKGHQSQLWMIIPATEAKYNGKGAFHLRSIYGKALESPGCSLDNQAKIQQGTFRGNDGQTWIIKEI